MFFGFIIFSVLSLLITQLVQSTLGYKELVTNKFWDLEAWIVRIELSNQPLSIEPAHLLAIRKNLEEAFLYDYNMIIEEYDFYEQLSP